MKAQTRLPYISPTREYPPSMMVMLPVWNADAGLAR